MYKAWAKGKTSRRCPFIEPSQKDRSTLTGIDGRLKQKAFDRLAVLRAYQRRLSSPGRLRTKARVIERFLDDFNSGTLRPDEPATSIRHLGRSTLYNWAQAYRKDRLPGLVPGYGVKTSTEKAVFRPLADPVEMKFPGRPRRNGKREFIGRLKRHWKIPPFECPIRLSIFYSMPIPPKTKMSRRMKMIRHQTSHIGKPNLDALNAFVVNCLTGIVFRDHSQIVHFSSSKQWDWWPQTRILVKPLAG
jgi:Holliday junction resolvase RusA-like endonuclease